MIYHRYYLGLCLLLVFAATSFTQDEEEGNLYGGDILLTSEQKRTMEATANPNDPFSPQNAVVRNERSLWPNGRVPYVLDSSLNTQARTAIQEAIDDYASLTCIRFVQRTNELDYVRFFRGSGCFSYIGLIRTGAQDISIGQGCEFKGIVIHEMFHALGRWHEQSRPDRDMYVNIFLENVRSGTENNFEITNPSFVTTQSIPYDLGSIMHYRATAFSRNGQATILPVDSTVDRSSLGQRNGLSERDIQHVQALYCGGTTGSWSSWGSWSSCSRSCNGGSQTRTRTCQNGVNCDGSNIETRRCNTESCPVPASWGAWSSWGSCSASCGGGRQTRTRRCVGGNTCVGISNQFRDCNTNSCPQPATWGEWGSWSSCSSTCQGGIRQRRRMCRNGNTCSGADFENENCNTNIPCTSGPNGEWSSWSSCSAECGGGDRFRVRCDNNNCDTEQESCNTQDCKPEPELRGLVYRGCYYLNTRSTRLLLLEGTTPDLSDDPFTRQNPVSKCGIAAQNQTYFFFGVTLGYCISGSNVFSDYTYYNSSLCRDGRGGYNRGYFIMDVYEITDQQSFRDSVVQAGVTTTSMSNTTAENSSSFKVTCRLLSIFLLLFIVLIMA